MNQVFKKILPYYYYNNRFKIEKDLNRKGVEGTCRTRIVFLIIIFFYFFISSFFINVTGDILLKLLLYKLQTLP